MAHSNTRQEKRAPVTLKIKFKSETLNQFIERYSVDISHGGIFIRTKDPLQVGTSLKFEFQLKDASPLITGDGTVVWTREQDPSRAGVAPGMGVRFDRLPQESQQTLEKILQRKQARSAPDESEAGSFIDTPTRVVPSPLVEGLAKGTSTSGADGAKPFESDADDFPEEAFEEATKVAALDALVKKTKKTEAEKKADREAEKKADREAEKKADREANGEKASAKAVKPKLSQPQVETESSVDNEWADFEDTSASDITSPGAGAEPEPEAESKPEAEPEPEERAAAEAEEEEDQTDRFKPEVAEETTDIASPPPVASAKPATAAGKETDEAAEAKAEPEAEEDGWNEPSSDSSPPVESPSGQGPAWTGPAKLRDEPAAAAASEPPAAKPAREARAEKSAAPVARASDLVGDDREGSNLAWIAAAAALLLIVGVGGWWVWGMRDQAGQKVADSESAAEQKDGEEAAKSAGKTAAKESSAGAKEGAGEEEEVAAEGAEATVTSEPEGATAELVGEGQKGPTPMTFTGLDPEREYTVRITSAGFLPHELTLKPAEFEPAPVKLKAATRALAIESAPRGAAIIINGRRKGRTPATVELTGKLAGASEYEVALQRSGYQRFKTTISADDNGFALDGERLVREVTASLDRRAVVSAARRRGSQGGGGDEESDDGGGASDAEGGAGKEKSGGASGDKTKTGGGATKSSGGEGEESAGGGETGKTDPKKDPKKESKKDPKKDPEKSPDKKDSEPVPDFMR